MKKKTLKRMLACVLSLIMAFGMVDTVSAATISKQLSASTGKLQLVLAGEQNDYSCEITSTNIKTKATSVTTSTSTVVDLSYSKTSWYKTTVKGKDSSGNYNGNNHTYYLAYSSMPKASKASGQRVKLKWTKITGTSYYKVYRKIGSSGSWKCIKQTKKTYYKTSKLKKNKKYYYYVRAVRKSGSKKYYSALPENCRSVYFY